MIKDLFKEFLMLNYEDILKNRNIPLKDINVDTLFILRNFQGGIKLLYLWKGDYILIPRSWVNLFSLFNVWVGNRIDDQVPENNIEEAIIILKDIVSLVDYSNIEKSFLLNHITKLFETRIEELREFINEINKDIRLGLIEYESLNKVLYL